MMKTYLVLGLLVGLLSACGSDDTTYTTVPYAFTAAVRSGMSSGLSVQGDMVLVQLSNPDRAVGLVIGAAGSQPIPVTAEKVGDNIHLSITMDNGQIIQGTGPFGGTFAEGPQTMQGDLTGPTATDKGDWAGKQRPCTQAQRKQCIDGVRQCVEYGFHPCGITDDFGDIASNRTTKCATCLKTALVIPVCRCIL